MTVQELMIICEDLNERKDTYCVYTQVDGKKESLALSWIYELYRDAPVVEFSVSARTLRIFCKRNNTAFNVWFEPFTQEEEEYLATRIDSIVLKNKELEAEIVKSMREEYKYEPTRCPDGYLNYLELYYKNVLPASQALHYMVEYTTEIVNTIVEKRRGLGV